MCLLVGSVREGNREFDELSANPRVLDPQERAHELDTFRRAEEVGFVARGPALAQAGRAFARPREPPS